MKNPMEFYFAPRGFFRLASGGGCFECCFKDSCFLEAVQICSLADHFSSIIVAGREVDGLPWGMDKEDFYHFESRNNEK